MTQPRSDLSKVKMKKTPEHKILHWFKRMRNDSQRKNHLFLIRKDQEMACWQQGFTNGLYHSKEIFRKYIREYKRKPNE